VPDGEAPALPSYDGLVLAGGAGRRLGGADKPALTVGGVPLLERALAALARAERVVVVGPPRVVGRAVTWVREEPPGGGPVAALAAGLPAVAAEVVVLLAGDLPFVTVPAVQGLLSAVGDGDGAWAVDHAGVDQPLLSAWRTAALRAALPDRPQRQRLRDVLAPLRAARVVLPGEPAPWRDCDTPEALAVARRLAAAGGGGAGAGS